MNATIEAYWQRCRREVPGLDATTYKVRSFGNDERLARRLLDLIRSGEKTGTFAVDWEFEADPAARPEPGDYYVAVDHAGRPELLIRVLATELVPFRDVAERHTRHEGKALRALDLWRKVHWDYWSATLAARGRTPSEHMPVLFQQFELVHAA